MQTRRFSARMTSARARRVLKGGADVPAFVLCLVFALFAPEFSASAAETHMVTIREFRFEPAELRVRTGDTVVWRNDEKRSAHSVLFLQRNIDESPRLFPDEQWQMTFTEAGDYPYRCGPHPEMRARIIVEAVQ